MEENLACKKQILFFQRKDAGGGQAFEPAFFLFYSRQSSTLDELSASCQEIKHNFFEIPPVEWPGGIFDNKGGKGRLQAIHGGIIYAEIASEPRQVNGIHASIPKIPCQTC